jgi:hypothetical protein
MSTDQQKPDRLHAERPLLSPQRHDAGPRAESAPANGETCVKRPGLCAAAANQNKPFCDGTQPDRLRINALDGGQNKRVNMWANVSPFMTTAVLFSRRFLHGRLKAVFRMRQEPWIDPDGAS